MSVSLTKNNTFIIKVTHSLNEKGPGSCHYVVADLGVIIILRDLFGGKLMLLFSVKGRVL